MTHTRQEKFTTTPQFYETIESFMLCLVFGTFFVYCALAFTEFHQGRTQETNVRFVSVQPLAMTKSNDFIK
jgi:hypothetical protein